MSNDKENGRKKKDRGEELRSRFQSVTEPVSESQTESQPESVTESQSEDSEPSQTNSQTTSQTESSTSSVMSSLIDEGDVEDVDDSVRSRKHVNMYLEEDLAEALDDRLTELDQLSKTRTGRGLQKNRDLYPALIEAAFSRDKDVVDVLNLRD